MSKKSNPKQNGSITELVFVIDRSGSMGGLESDTIGGVNAVLAKNRTAPGEAQVTTALFDHEILYLHDHQDLRRVQDLTRRDYQVRGCTALLDAVGDTIEHVDRVQGYLPAAHKADHVIVTIVTDGYENASKRWDYARVKRAIEAHKELGWEFLFLGANIDVAAEASRIGISADYAAPYVADGMGTQVAYEAVAAANVAVRACGYAPKSWANAVRADARARG